jgi:hypothetical protein
LPEGGYRAVAQSHSVMQMCLSAACGARCEGFSGRMVRGRAMASRHDRAECPGWWRYRHAYRYRQRL